MNSNSKNRNDFRNTLATADKQGKRIWVYPTRPKGKFHSARQWVSYLLLALLFGGPFIKISGKPILMLNIIERQFVIFGETFYPQDFFLFALFSISIIVIVFLFTAIYGRLFCGWICPQTIFMEMVFRKIEYFIEGSAQRQRDLNNAPWTASKFFKKTSKHVIFYGISFLIGNTFLAYIIGIDSLIEIITDPPSQHVTGLSVMIIFSLIFYWVFAWFREQVCTLVCPYGRLQSVLLDSNTIVVAYDNKRGEPREPMNRNQSRENQGDCIDCDACVKVCPTGIDIRNGTQLECINCTACIDACDFVMEKVNLPTGLIRYSSLNNIEYGRKFQYTPRIIGYSLVLFFIVVLTTTLLFARSDVDISILRTPGSLYQESQNGIIQNIYNLRVINKTSDKMPIVLKLKNIEGQIKVVSGDIVVEENGTSETVIVIELNKKHLFTAIRLIEIQILSNGELIDEIRTNFLGPKPVTGR